MRHSLTDARLRTIPLPLEGQLEVWDTRIPGFGIRVSHGGAKAFILLYRFEGRARRLTLGRYPTINVVDARKLAHQALRSVALGSDPGAEKIRARRIPALEQFDGFVAHYIESYARPKNRTAHETERLLRREFVSNWRKRPITSIARQDVLLVLDRLMAGRSPPNGKPCSCGRAQTIQLGRRARCGGSVALCRHQHACESRHPRPGSFRRRTCCDLEEFDALACALRAIRSTARAHGATKERGRRNALGRDRCTRGLVVNRRTSKQVRPCARRSAIVMGAGHRHRDCEDKIETSFSGRNSDRTFQDFSRWKYPAG